MVGKPLVSVAVPTYHRNERLLEAVKSVLDREWPVEVVVVDGFGEAHARPVADERPGVAP